MPRRAEDEAGDAGFALLSVLLAAALFTAVAAGMAVRSRLLVMETVNRGETVAAQALADGAALFAADAMRPPRAVPLGETALVEAALAGRAAMASLSADALPLPPDGTPVSCPLANGNAMEAAAVDQGALLDLNGASVPMLRDVLSGAGLSGEDARRLADEIADFRDPDDAPQDNGIGEKAHYAALGLGWGPANAPFADAEEIARLPGISPERATRLRPLFTVANPRAGLDLALAPRASRGRLSEDAVRESSLRRWNLASTRTSYEVVARLRRADGSLLAARRARVSFGGQGSTTDMRILRWAGLGTDEAIPATQTSAPFCAALTRALGEEIRR